eukprot:gene5410-6749_t
MIKQGERVPFDVTLWKALPALEDGTCPVAQKIVSKDLFENKKVVVFALPGAYTPTCSAKHLPGFIDLAGEFKKKGIDNIYCLATNDAFVMTHWGKDNKAGDKVTLIADGNSEFTKKIGMEFDGSQFGLGNSRSKRYAMIIDNGVINHLAVEEPGKFEVSNAESVLQNIK